ncbi:MAG: DNA-3-methyladenine glycosylase [Candidatus Saccharimonas sp.]
MDKALKHLAKNDPKLRKLIARYPKPTFEEHNHYYQELVESIIGQQLSVGAASSIRRRFVELFDGQFPTPEQILALEVEDFRAAGLSRPKARYIQDLAQKVTLGEIKFDTLSQLSNDDVITELTAVKGVGIWTAHMFLMFAMARLDILPVGDLGIRNGIAKLYNIDHQPSPEEIVNVAAANSWHPYESVASWYIWASLDNKPLN